MQHTGLVVREQRINCLVRFDAPASAIILKFFWRKLNMILDAIMCKVNDKDLCNISPRTLLYFVMKSQQDYYTV